MEASDIYSRLFSNILSVYRRLYSNSAGGYRRLYSIYGAFPFVVASFVALAQKTLRR